MDAQIPDQEAFAACIAKNETAGTVAEDIRLGHEIGIRVLPTIFLDEAREASAPSAATILRRVRDTVAAARRAARGIDASR
jgi:protein-disulfide isomerase